MTNFQANQAKEPKPVAEPVFDNMVQGLTLTNNEDNLSVVVRQTVELPIFFMTRHEVEVYWEKKRDGPSIFDLFRSEASYMISVF